MHGADAAARFDRQRQHGRIARQRGHVVDDLRAGMDRMAGHQRLRGVDRNGQAGLLAQCADHGHDAAKLLLHVDRLGIRPGALAADIEDVGALGGQPQAVLHGGVGVETVPAVGKTVRRDVDDAHQQRQLAHGERAGAELPVVGAVEVGGSMLAV